jgi:hypothetical protein
MSDLVQVRNDLEHTFEILSLSLLYKTCNPLEDDILPRGPSLMSHGILPRKSDSPKRRIATNHQTPQ